MRVRAVTPIRVTEQELDRRQRRYSALAPDGVEIELVNLADGAPRRLETADDIAASDRLTLEEAQRTDADRYDLVLPDCVLDPAVDSGEPTPVPVVGILQLSASFLASLGLRFTAVTRNRAIGDELAARLRRYGLDGSFGGVDVLDLDFEAISDEGRWHEALRPVRRAVAARGSDAIINGCSAVEVAGHEDEGAAVVDPTRLALELLGVGARTGIVGGAR